MSRRIAAIFALCLGFSAGCGSEPPASVSKDATTRVDTGDEPLPDAGFAPDAEDVTPDAEDQTPDATPLPDATEPPDAGFPDALVLPDAQPLPDAQTFPDATVPDSGLPLWVDTDLDNISDADEGNTLVDTDRDGTPDANDPDSDGDGIPDAAEAGDADPATPPVDTDHDGTPDFRDTDSDNDGIPDAVEGTGDSDGDGVPDYRDGDGDDDGIRDLDEGTGDADGDTLPNYLDVDSDGDGIPDAVEAGDADPITRPIDTDADGTPDFLDADSDNDGILDRDEGDGDPDGDQIPSYRDIDSDNDSVLDLVEAGDGDPSTPPIDTDGDGTPDFRDTDSDGDTIFDLAERDLDADGDTLPNRLDLDSDGDGFPDAVEAGDAILTTPPVDTDGDSIPDYLDLDSDADGIADAVELGCPMATARASADSDNDGFVNPAELAYGSNPCSAASGINDFYFILPPGGPGANAPLVFSNTNIDKADFAINMDNTGSMQGEINNLRTTLTNGIIPGVRAVVPDSAFAVSHFEDYPIDPFGMTAYTDVPFTLGTRVTTDAAAAQSAVNVLVTHNGLDFPEAGLESLYQIASGAGTSWPGGSVLPFDPSANRVPNVADGSIGGVGFREGALPIVVQVTDAISHTRRDYTAVNAGIGAADNAQVKAALGAIGARVVTISSGLLPFDDLLCNGQLGVFFGAVAPADVDWYELQGAVAGDTVQLDAVAAGYLSPLDTMAAVYNASARLAFSDDISATNTDSQAVVVLSGAGPFYVAITAYGDTNFVGAGGTTSGHYIGSVLVNGQPWVPSPTQCRADDANARAGATPLVNVNVATVPANVAQCITDCETALGGYSPLFEDYTFPYEISEDTNAVVPACAWSAFGPGRPVGCGPDQCCTGLNGTGVPTNAANLCPLAFEIDETGAGLDQAMITGVQALVSFSTFTVTTEVRPDPVQLGLGLDTRCFIHGVVPTTATPPNTCAPAPHTADLLPPSPELDSFVNVVPGTVLSFQVNAINQSATTSLPCVAATTAPQLFRAYIDVIADGITVVDTRSVIIIVPPTNPGGQH